jgi:Protein of unknown function (DUF2631)
MARHDSETALTHGSETEVVPVAGDGAHRHERPEDWGWHADLSVLARVGGIFTIIALALMLTATHYNHAGTAALLICLFAVLGGLIWDQQKRRTRWRR